MMVHVHVSTTYSQNDNRKEKEEKKKASGDDPRCCNYLTVCMYQEERDPR